VEWNYPEDEWKEGVQATCTIVLEETSVVVSGAGKRKSPQSMAKDGEVIR